MSRAVYAWIRVHYADDNEIMEINAALLLGILA
jgi:hypothetical protein